MDVHGVVLDIPTAGFEEYHHHTFELGGYRRSLSDMADRR